MTIDIVVPTLGESVTEATVAKWFKGPGDAVALDEPLVELETDKVSIEVGALAAGAAGAAPKPGVASGTDEPHTTHASRNATPNTLLYRYHPLRILPPPAHLVGTALRPSKSDISHSAIASPARRA